MKNVKINQRVLLVYFFPTLFLLVLTVSLELLFHLAACRVRAANSSGFLSRMGEYFSLMHTSCFMENIVLNLFFVVFSIVAGIFIGFKLNSLITLRNHLARSEKRLHEAFNVLREGVFEWIYPEERIYVSESFFRLCGFDRPTQFISMAERAELIHPDDIEYEHEQMAEAVASRSLADFQIRLRHKDGYYFPVRIRGKVYPADTAARAFCIVGTVRDISEELVSRERIAQLNSRLNSALLLTGEIVFEISCPELVVRSNISPNLQLAGFPVSFLTMRPLNSFLSGVEFEQLRAWMNATPDTYTYSETFRLDITLSLENLLSIPVRLVFRKGTRDGQKILVMNVRDLSAEQEENIRLTILKTVFGQLDSAFVVARLSGGVYCYNDAAGQIFPGIRENRKIWDFLPEFDETKYGELWDTAKINSVQILTFRRDGAPYEAVCSRLNVASGFLCIQYNKRMP